MTEKVAIRTPRGEDLALAVKDMVTLRTAPPMAMSLAVVFLLTGNIITSLLGVGAASFAHALWARLLS